MTCEGVVFCPGLDDRVESVVSSDCSVGRLLRLETVVLLDFEPSLTFVESCGVAFVE